MMLHIFPVGTMWMENREYEMVVTDKGQTWVNFWGLWEGTLPQITKHTAFPHTSQHNLLMVKL